MKVEELTRSSSILSDIVTAPCPTLKTATTGVVRLNASIFVKPTID